MPFYCQEQRYVRSVSLQPCRIQPKKTAARREDQQAKLGSRGTVVCTGTYKFHVSVAASLTNEYNKLFN